MNFLQSSENSEAEDTHLLEQLEEGGQRRRPSPRRRGSPARRRSRWWIPWSSSNRCPGSRTRSRSPGVSSSGSSRSPSSSRPLEAQAVVPQELFWTVPPDSEPGESLIINGPCGPLGVQVPPDKGPGDECSIFLGPSESCEVVVPENCKPGDIVTFEDDMFSFEVSVPPGKLPGETFLASPPMMMVQVPEGAQFGDEVVFQVNGRRLCADVPEGFAPGTFFAARV